MKERRDPDLAALLAAAAAPDPERDGGERGLEAVLAAYRAAADAPVRETDMMGAVEGRLAAAGSGSGRAGSRVPSPRRGRFTLALAVKCAAVLVVVAGTGVAAASVGALPAPMQRLAHDYLGGVGIPAPATAPPSVNASATPRLGPSRPDTPNPTPVPTGSASAQSGQATPNELLALCEIVVQAGDNWHSDLDKAQRDLLTTAAGGNPQVPAYCATVIASNTPSAPAASPSATSDNGNGNGGGNGGGNGDGKGHASKSPAPHSTKN